MLVIASTTIRTNYINKTCPDGRAIPSFSVVEALRNAHVYSGLSFIQSFLNAQASRPKNNLSKQRLRSNKASDPLDHTVYTGLLRHVFSDHGLRWGSQKGTGKTNTCPGKSCLAPLVKLTTCRVWACA